MTTTDQIRQYAAEIAEEAIRTKARRLRNGDGWPGADFEQVDPVASAAIADRLDEIAEEVATRA